MSYIKKSYVVGLILIFFIIYYNYCYKQRSSIDLEEKANREFTDYKRINKIEKKYNFTKLPSIRNDVDEIIIFSWYTILDTGDTTVIRIEINECKCPLFDENITIREDLKSIYLSI
jgi:hypothetical protein